MDQPPSEFGLVMPFVTCTSNGGPHDDGTFVAGYECGQIDAELALAASIHAQPRERYVSTDSVPQVDLIAMRHGFHMTAEPWGKHPDEWTLVKFAPPTQETPDE